jgi:hypothetical protein
MLDDIRNALLNIFERVWTAFLSMKDWSYCDTFTYLFTLLLVVLGCVEWKIRRNQKLNHNNNETKDVSNEHSSKGD